MWVYLLATTFLVTVRRGTSRSTLTPVCARVEVAMVAAMGCPNY